MSGTEDRVRADLARHGLDATAATSRSRQEADLVSAVEHLVRREHAVADTSEQLVAAVERAADNALRDAPGALLDADKVGGLFTRFMLNLGALDSARREEQVAAHAYRAARKQRHGTT